jgi:hypothetical protein
MLTTLAFLLLSAMPCTNCATATGTNNVTLSITFTCSIASSHSIATDMTQIDKSVDGVYRLAVKESFTGTDKPFEKEEIYLVMDDHDVLLRESIMVAFEDDDIKLNIPKEVVAYVWPDGTSIEQMAAIVKSKRAVKIFETFAKL